MDPYKYCVHLITAPETMNELCSTFLKRNVISVSILHLYPYRTKAFMFYFIKDLVK